MCKPTEGGPAFINELNERKLVNPTLASRGQGGTRQTRWTGAPFQPVRVAGAGEELSSLCVVAEHGPFGGRWPLALPFLLRLQRVQARVRNSLAATAPPVPGLCCH